MKMRKKITMISLVLLLIAGVFSGCASKTGNNQKDDPNEEVTLVIAFPRAEQKDAEMVVEEINKRLEKFLPNTKIELLFDQDMGDKWSLWMSTKKKIDLAHSGFITDLEEEVSKETYLPLDDLIEECAPTLQELQKTYWNAYDGATINGSLYAVPNVQAYVKSGMFLRMWDEAAAHTDLQALKEEAWSSDRTTERFWKILSEGLDTAATAGVDCANCFNISMYNIAKRGYVFIGGEDSNICYAKSGDGTILDFYTTDEFKSFCKYMKDWAAKGYISKDILTGAWTDNLYAGNDFYYGVNEETGIQEVYGYEDQVTLCLDNPDNTVLTTNIGDQQTYWSIPFSSAHPERAMKFLDLLHSEEGAEIVNLLAYGIEGTHYEFVDKEHGDIRAFEYQGQGYAEVSYGVANWMVSNMLQGMYKVAPYTHDLFDWAEEYYAGLKDYKKHELYGFSFDTDSISGELSQVLKNNSEYASSIYTGVAANSDELMKTLTDRNQAVGLDKIMKELQKQADEYVKSK